MIRMDVTFHGRVQGVGFRATVRDAARQFRVGGWVRNEPDGTVRLVMDGAQSEVHGLIEEVRRRMERFITRIDQTQASITDSEAEAGFEVRL